MRIGIAPIPMSTWLFLLSVVVGVVLHASGTTEPTNEGLFSDPETESVSLDSGGLSRDKFPKGFVFGTATSAYQVEGIAHKDGRGPSIWDTFVKIPGIVANNGTADVSVDRYHRYKVSGLIATKD